MTEAGNKWVAEIAKNAMEINSEFLEWTDPLSRRAAEFWIRAFLEKVKKRAAQLNGGYEGRSDWCIAEAVKSTKRELLGES